MLTMRGKSPGQRHALIRFIGPSLLLAILGLSLHGAAQVRPPAPKRYLFLDPAIVETSNGISLRVDAPQRRETVIVPDKPWEHEMISFFLTVREEGSKIRMWYICRDSQNAANLAYAESEDGVHWIKPNLGIVNYHGSKNNNLVGIQATSGVVFVDPNAPPDRRYASVNDGNLNFEQGGSVRRAAKNDVPASPGRSGGLHLYVSPDGLHWQREARPLLWFTSDTQNVVFWDGRIQQYVLYLRGRDFNPSRRKVVRLAVSSLKHPIQISGTHFPGNNTNRAPLIGSEIPTVLKCDGKDPSRTDIYNISAQPYLLDPAWYVGFPTFLRRSKESDAPNYHGPDRGPAEVEFVGSRDGINWNRYDRATYVSPGGDGTESEKVAFMGTGLVARDGELWQYGTVFRTEHGDVQGRREKTDGAIVRFVQREDGFVSADSPAKGALRTVAIPVTGAQLILNVNTGALGEVRVGLAGENGSFLPGFAPEQCLPVQANSTHAVVSWANGADLSKLADQKVHLVFRLDRAKLYSFRFDH